MASLDPAIGAPLTFQEVKRLVEQASPVLELRHDTDNGGAKGRFLVAKKALKPGDIVLSEFPLFHGNPSASYSRKACTEEFVSVINDSAAEDDEDCLHPCSPLIDCLSAVILAKYNALHAEDKGKRALSKLKIRQLLSLSAKTPDPCEDESMEEFLGTIRPEYRALITVEELRDILCVVSNNRFSGADHQIDLMYAGSMFEHSCRPNCFAANWTAKTNSSTYRAKDSPRVYRAMCEVEVGEPLSISYIQMPELYLPREDRAELLSGWQFTCVCPRCTHLPELTRTFLCPACKAPELCPPHSGPDVQELRCQGCGHNAEAVYVAKCFQLEGALRRIAAGEEAPNVASSSSGENDIISCLHHFSFQLIWTQIQDDLGDIRGRVHSTIEKMEEVIRCITWWAGDARHPTLLELYHTMAELHCGNIEGQRRYLYLEREVLRHCYPEEAERQDEEIWNLVTGNGPRGAKPTKKSDVELDGMD